MRSNMHASQRRFGISLFNGFWGTRPTHEESAAGAGRICDLIAPEDGPMVVEDKARGLFFLPCVLKDAPLTGKTRENAEKQNFPLAGKMRSAEHVTEGGWAKLDGDGLTHDQFEELKAKLAAAGIARIIFSTHSHGTAEKPGIRCRIIVFFDRDLEPTNYERAVLSLSHWLLGESLDESEARLHQQAGTWCAHPDRVDQAFCIRELDGACVSVDAMLTAAPKVRVNTARGSPVLGTESLNQERIEEALALLDANEYGLWIDAAIWLKSAYGDAAYTLWLTWSQTAGDEHRAEESKCEQVWNGVTPRITGEQGAGALFGRVRDAAVGIVRSAAACGAWDQNARAAMVYLRLYHQRLYAEMFEVAA